MRERPPHIKPPRGRPELPGEHTVKRLIIAIEDLEFAVNRLERGLSRLHGVLGVTGVSVNKEDK